MANDLGARCESCVYAAPAEKKMTLTGERLLECRVDPPQAYPIAQPSGAVGLGSAFRPTYPHWWCGKYRAGGATAPKPTTS
jgi:hypothetical protein